MGALVGDRTLYIVPLSVRQNARLGLQLRRKSKRTKDIPHSFEVATALITGKVNKMTLIKMFNFFAHKKSVVTKAHTPEEKLLFGGNEGLKFVLEYVRELKQ